MDEWQSRGATKEDELTAFFEQAEALQWIRIGVRPTLLDVRFLGNAVFGSMSPKGQNPTRS